MNTSNAQNDNFFSGVGRSAYIIIILTLLDKIFALTKEILFAYTYGVSSDLDVFNISYAFPGVLCLLCAQSVDSSFVPVYLKFKSSTEERNSFVLLLIFLFSLLSFAVTVLLICNYTNLFLILGYGFSEDSLFLGLKLGKFLLWIILVDNICAVLLALLHAEKLFFEIYSTQVLLNIVLILFVVFFQKYGVWALAWGTLAGSIVRFLCICFICYFKKLLVFAKFSIVQDSVKDFFKQLVPLLSSSLIVNSNILVDQVMSTELNPGAVSALRYAYRINEVPVQVLVISISKAIFPFASAHVIDGDFEALKNIFERALYFISFVSFIIIGFVSVFSYEIVYCLLARGAFEGNAVSDTSRILFFYSIGMWFYSYTFVNGVFFCALQRNNLLFCLGILATLLNVVLNKLFMDILHDPSGIALSTSVNSAILSVIFIIILNKKMNFVKTVFLSIDFFKLIVSLIFSCVFMYFFRACVSMFSHFIVLASAVVVYFVMWLFLLNIVCGSKTKETLCMIVPAKVSKYFIW